MCIKLQHIQQQGVTFDGVLKAGYDLNYTYGAKPHQIDNIKDENYRTEGKDVKKPKKTENVYEYDLNGNLLFVSKNKSKDEKQNERKLLWDEENRLEAVSDNGYVSLYTYDAGGERVTKLSGNGESVYVNSLKSGARTQTNKYTAYISPYFVLSSGGQYTKHIMIGSQRIVSKLGDVGSFGQDPRRIEYAGTTEGIKIDHKAKYTASQHIIKEKYSRLKVVYNGVDNNDYRGGDSFCCGKKKKDGFGARGGITNNDKPELHQYYYHPDHLGSSSYITNLDGEVVQHIEYVPFGEVFLNEQNNKWNTPYLFNGKELDEETGLYYYGARYYNPRESVWLSVDPLALYNPIMDSEHYLDGEHNEGVFNSGNLAAYSYTYGNPVRYVDPNGKQVDFHFFESNWDDFGLRLSSNLTTNYKNTIQIDGHGNRSKGLYIPKERDLVNKTGGYIDGPNTFNEHVSKVSDEWNNRDSNGLETVIIYACNIARDRKGKSPVLKLISKGHPDQVFIGASELVWGSWGKNKSYGEDSKGKQDKNKPGEWRLYKAGKLLARYHGDWNPKPNPTKSDKEKYLLPLKGSSMTPVGKQENSTEKK